MRLYLVLTTLAVTLAFLAGYLLFGGLGVPVFEPVTLASAASVIQEFSSAQKPIGTADLTSLFPRVGLAELVHPQTAMNHSQLFPYDEMQALYRAEKSCVFAPDEKKSAEPGLKKAWTWARYRCGELDELPSKFFGAAPYMHPFGTSYALLYAQSGKGGDKRWLKFILPYLHVTEYREAEKLGVKLSWARKILSRLGNDELVALLQNFNTLLTADHLFIRYHSDPTGDVDVLSPSTYRIYSAASWRDFIREKHGDLAARIRESDEKCPVLTDNICWEANPDTFADFMNKYVIVFFIGSVALLGLILAALLVKMRQEKKAEERRIFGLRTLTHELRTPVASLVLHIETLKSDFDKLSEDAQDAYMRLNSDASRLRRLVESSRQYLNTAAGAGLITLDPKSVPSANEHIADLLSDYLPRIRLHRLSDDQALASDSYWLGVCLKNLVENALQHGALPVEVFLTKKDGELHISVQDAGRVEAVGYKDMVTPFRRGEKSTGYGLGLSLVERIAKEMGGGLRFETSPTRFTLVLKGVL